MTSNISESELLDLSVEPFEEEMQGQEEGTSTSQSQQSFHYTKEIQSPQPVMGTSNEMKRLLQADKRQNEQQQTLKTLNKKLDSLHTQLERTKHLHAIYDRRPAFRPLMQRNLPFNNDSVYEITNSPANITIRISDRRHLRWNAQEQCLIIRAPQRFDTTSVWHNRYGQKIHTVTHSTDYAKYVHIRGIHIEAIHRAYFYFRPAPKYQNIFLEERPFTKDGIKLRLTRAASKQALVINKNEYIGNLQIITPLATRIIA